MKKDKAKFNTWKNCTINHYFYASLLLICFGIRLLQELCGNNLHVYHKLVQMIWVLIEINISKKENLVIFISHYTF